MKAKEANGGIRILNADGEVLNSNDDDYFVIAQSAFERLGLKGNAAVEVIIAVRDEIQRVNAQSRNKDSVTDVLSFPFLNEIKPFTRSNYPLDYDTENGGVLLGSIMICEDIAREQAEQFGHSLRRERGYLFLHGLLHLLAFDHEDEESKAKMRAAEEDILSQLGILR